MATEQWKATRKRIEVTGNKYAGAYRKILLDGIEIGEIVGNASAEEFANRLADMLPAIEQNAVQKHQEQITATIAELKQISTEFREIARTAQRFEQN